MLEETPINFGELSEHRLATLGRGGSSSGSNPPRAPDARDRASLNLFGWTAQRVRTLILRDFDRAYESFDVLLGPTAPSTAFAFGAKADPLAMYLNDVCTIPSNLAGHPAISVPFGTGDGGLPVGVQVLAPALGEVAMFNVAAALEAAAP